MMAHTVSSLPTEMDRTGPGKPWTSTGLVLLPTMPLPQHRRPPPARIAHACVPPLAERYVTPDPSPGTATGVALGIIEPVPSSPTEFPPQHWTAPAVVSKQPNPSDIWTAEMPDGTATMRCGVAP